MHHESDPGAWAAGLPDLVRELAERWSLRVAAPYETEAGGSWVAPVRDDAGRDLVLKVSRRHEEAEHEVDGLRAWADHGAVHVHDAHRSHTTDALLLERCRPGTPLSAVAEPEQDEIVAGLLRRLWTASPRGSAFRPLQSMCDAWAAEFEQRLEREPGTLDPGLARAGIELLRELPGTAERHVLLATDLHAGNVLAAQREPWLVIDPKPYVGDRAYDALQHMLNCEERLAADPSGFARRMAGLLEVDADRLLHWLFARCVQESVEQPSLRPTAAALAPG